MKLFLTAKHWQLFLLMFGWPFLLQIVLIGSIFKRVASGQNQIDVSYMQFFPWLMVLLTGLLFGWIWAVAIGLQHKLPEGARMNTTLFKTFYFIALVYLIAFCGLMALFLGSIFEHPTEPNPAIFGAFIFIVPMHLLAMFCIFYCMYFAAKTLKSVELQRPTKFSDYSAEFFMIWFYPIGVWIIQPIINKVAQPDYEPPKFPHY